MSKKKQKSKNQQQAQRRQPKISYAVAVLPGTINTDYAQKAHNRHYKRVGGSLYQISVVGRKIGANLINEDAIDGLETQISETIDGQIGDMQTLINEMKEKAGDQLEQMRMEYINPLQVEFRYSTQLQKKYTDLLLKLDELVVCIDRMTMLFLMSAKEKVTMSYTWRRNIESTSSEIITVASAFSHCLDEAIKQRKVCRKSVSDSSECQSSF